MMNHVYTVIFSPFWDTIGGYAVLIGAAFCTVYSVIWWLWTPPRKEVKHD
jgi:hypothetical protein